MTAPPATTVVVPTIGRASLHTLLEALVSCVQQAPGSAPPPVLVVDDRPGGPELVLGTTLPDVTVVRSWGRGPAAARNVGWRHARTEWVSFLDDDVVPETDWLERLHEDLAAAGSDVAGVAGRVRVPLPGDRRPTDWERSTKGLETARWITADLSYRRAVLAEVGGFDERFPRAFREDADLGLRVTRTGARIEQGRRQVLHPPRPSGFWASVHQQRGNADDFLMRALHGPRWHDLVGAPRGRRRRHAVVTAAGVLALGALLTRRGRVAAAAGFVWLAGTAELATARIRPGPRSAAEAWRMVATSAVLPAAATWHGLRGAWRHRAARPWRGAPELVLFDRDGTLVEDVPYNGDPERVRPVPSAAPALARLRAAGVRVGMVTNQSAVGTGRITLDQLEAVQSRVCADLGPFDVVRVCPHAPDAGCDCRKPQPGLVLSACADAGASPSRTVVVGDIETDLLAARAAGAASLLVPNAQTQAVEVARAQHTGRLAADLGEAADRLLHGAW
jgi:histidinol-phosphate phosphatase family protein